jgi:hypothetical protein
MKGIRVPATLLLKIRLALVAGATPLRTLHAAVGRQTPLTPQAKVLETEI